MNRKNMIQTLRRAIELFLILMLAITTTAKIYDSADVLKFDQSKKTGNNGIAKFGYSQPYDTIGSDSDNNRVEVWTGDTYMEKRFSIKVD